MSKSEINKSAVKLTCSFKDYLNTELSCFLRGFKSDKFTSDILSEFVLIQATYQEEGALVFPTFFITDDLDRLVKAVEGRDLLHIGEANYSSNSVHKVFKQCAVLASEKSWVVYVAICENNFRYGVFRTDQYPLSPTSFERLRLIQQEDLKVIGLNRLGRNFVEIRAADGQSRYVNTGSDQDQSLAPKEVIQRFAKTVIRDVDSSLRDSMEAFYYRVGFDILHGRSGTILAILREGASIPKLFEDGIRLSNPISIAANIHELFSGKDVTEGYQQLEGSATLIRNMANMDGVTVIDSAGTVIGYNFFVKQEALGTQQTRSVVGGARRRAFEVIREQVGSEIQAVLYKSSDGALQFATAFSEVLVGPYQ